MEATLETCLTCINACKEAAGTEVPKEAVPVSLLMEKAGESYANVVSALSNCEGIEIVAHKIVGKDGKTTNAMHAQPKAKAEGVAKK